MLKKVLTATALSAILVTSALAQEKNFVSEQKSDQFLASKFKGTDVVGTDNQKIGDVNDVLFDKSGKIHALVIGVGGFLGLGAKDVALNMESFEVMPASATSAGGNTSATTGSSADGTNIKLKLSMTKDELKNAPDFKAYQPPAPARPATTGTSPGGGATKPGGSTQ